MGGGRREKRYGFGLGRSWLGFWRNRDWARSQAKTLSVAGGAGSGSGRGEGRFTVVGKNLFWSRV